MPTFDEDLLLEQVRKLRGMQAPPEPPVTSPAALQGSPYLQAAQVEQQAMTPKPDPFAGMSPLKRMLGQALTGVAGGTIHAQDPGGYQGYLDRERAFAYKQQQDQLQRAKELRGEGRQQSIDYATGQNQQLALERQRAIDDLNRMNIVSEIKARERAKAGMGAQGTYIQEAGEGGPPVGSIVAQAPTRPDTSLTPFEAWQQQNPNAPITDWLKANVPAVNPETERHNRAMEATAARRAAASEKQAAGGTTADASNAYQAEHAQRVVSAVDFLLPKVSRTTVGVGTDTLANVPVLGQPARDFRAALDELKSNIAFNELTQMRAASKTGGALGQVAVRELELLESTLGSINPLQSPEQMTMQLNKIKASVQRWQTAQAMQGAGNANVTVPAERPRTMILNGKTLTLGPDGKYH